MVYTTIRLNTFICVVFYGIYTKLSVSSAVAAIIFWYKPD